MLPDADRPILPMSLRRQPVTDLHQAAYFGAADAAELLKPRYLSGVKTPLLVCAVCAQVNPTRDPGLRKPCGGTLGGDFTGICSAVSTYKYLLVFVDNFSAWVEAYPT